MKLARIVTALALCVVAPVSADPQQPRTGQLAELSFDVGSARLPARSPDVAPQLDDVATWSRANPDGLIVIAGHPDAACGATHNAQLSVQRATQVKKELIARGVDPTMIVISAFEDNDAARPGVVVWGTLESHTAVAHR